MTFLERLFITLSGPIDVDKMDYLMWTVLHAGVPYGRHFDQDRLLTGLCLDDKREITRSTKRAGPLQILWSLLAASCSVSLLASCCRSATAMLQRTIWLSRERPDTDCWCNQQRIHSFKRLNRQLKNRCSSHFGGLFGRYRKLFKRIAAFTPNTLLAQNIGWSST